jgi:hypothetical protein
MTTLRLVQLGIVALFSMRKANIVLKLLSTGINHDNYSNGYQKTHYQKKARSIHAEEMAIDKLKANQSKEIKVSLLVIRITSASDCEDYHLCQSRPCVACISRMISLKDFGYCVSKIYYSDENGNILCYRFKDIIKEKQHLSKHYRFNNIPRKLLRDFEIYGAK